MFKSELMNGTRPMKNDAMRDYIVRYRECCDILNGIE